jgi:uncharacterized protein (TIGR02421 family)
MLHVKSDSYEEIPAEFTEDVCAALTQGKRVRRSLPGGGVLNIDRLLPFLCVYRRNPQRLDGGTRTFVNGEAAYLNAPGDAPVRRGLRRLVRRVAETASRQFDAFLIVEIWSSPDEQLGLQAVAANGDPVLAHPKFHIHERSPNQPRESVDALKLSLQRIKLHGRQAEVDVSMQSHVHPPGSQPLLTAAEIRQINCYLIGLEIGPVYREGDAEETFPAVLRHLHRGVGRALKKAFFAFSLERTNVRPQHFYALGRRTLAKLVWDVDGQLSDVARQYNLLWQATPVNAESSWLEFQENGFGNEPRFQYRPLGIDPMLLKRRLNLIATERLADATFAHLFRQTQDESDRLLTMMTDIGTRKFLPGSLQVFGGVESSLLALASELLRTLSPRDAAAGPQQELVAPRAFAQRASQQIHAYRRQYPEFAAAAYVRVDMYSGLMASAGDLLIGRDAVVPAHRVEALLAHEVGTHLVTYYNGLAQPLKLLSTGLAGYDALQEGLAVLAEFLVGGLSKARLRLLAARVVAAHAMIEQATFADTFRLLSETHGFEARTSYTVALRVFRGGGLTKDAVYLRGLVEILDFLRRGGDLSLLLVGKLAVDHVPIIRELTMREVLRPAPVTPQYMTLPAAEQRLERLRRGMTVLELVEDGTS